MAGEWAPINLGDVCTKVGSGATPRGGSDVYLERGPYALIRSQNVRNDGFRHDGLAYIGEKHAAELGGVEVLAGDVLLNITGDSVARACQVDPRVLPARVNQHVAIIRPRPNRLDPRFLRYFLVSAEMQHKLLSWAGSGGTRNALTKAMIESFDVLAPEDINEQRAIAHILGTLDDKIELNRRMSETLEAMARALFKSWFIDFDPVRRNAARARNQPSPPTPLPVEERGMMNDRGGHEFAGLVGAARDLREKQTSAEALLWELVRDRRFLGLEFRRQHQLGDYIADFYCHEHRLVVELDAGVHATRQKKDHERDAWLQAQGYTVVRFRNQEIFDDIESVLSHLAQALPLSRIGSRAVDEGVTEGEAFDHLFPARFVDSELGEIPEGWEVGCVDDEFDVTMGQSPPGETYNEAGNGLPFYQGRADFGSRFPTRRVYCTEPTRMAKAGDTLISVRAPVGDINMATEDCAIGRGVAAARHKRGSRSYTYQFMVGLEEVFSEFEAEGTVFGSIGKKDFHGICCARPTRAVIEAFETMLAPIDSRFETAERESRTLAALRDALLPKLISGGLRIPDAETFIEGVI